MKVAIIPVRGGSKRIPGKNIKLFSGKPLVTYPIQVALDSRLFDKVIVSTDSAEIAEIARKAGAEVPFVRPDNLSDDFTPTIPVLKHAVNWLDNNGFMVEYLCCLYANPFITTKNICGAYEILTSKDATSVIPVTTFPFPIYRSVKFNEKGEVIFIYPDFSLTRSQDLEEAYHDTGQFYWWDCKKFMATDDVPTLQRVNRYPLVIPRYMTQDLDTPEDWIMAEKLYKTFMET